MKLKLHWQILIAIFAAAVIGFILQGIGGGAADTTAGVFAFLGKLFLNALHMIVVPLIVSSIICGVFGLGGSADIGRMGGRTLGFYVASSFLAILVGLVIVNITQPGIVGGEPAHEQLNLSSPEELQSSLSKIENRDAGDIASVFMRMIPTNVIEAAANGQLLGLIFFSILFGFFMTRIQQKHSETLENFWQGVFETMMQMTLFTLRQPLSWLLLVATSSRSIRK